ncbi:MAG: HEPN domain-containing protein [bacterium]|nr:HEPN domain-containing protein [bacterium]
MNETVKEWVDKAEADFATAKRELQVTDYPNYDAVCFHAQQGVEKLMKALLIHVGVMPPKTHRLLALDELLRPVCSDWTADKEDLQLLTRAAVDFRYPGETADFEEAKDVVDVSLRLREALLHLLGD